MWCILSDNLSLNNILDECKNPERKDFRNSYYIQKYLYAVILWDAIYHVQRKGFSVQAYNKVDERRQENKLVRDIKSTIHYLPFDYYSELENLADYIYDEEICLSGMDMENEELREDVKFYITMGEISDMNTLLSEERTKFIEQAGMIKKMWTREDALKCLDHEVFEIYKEVYSYLGKDVINIQSPLLIDYICDNATTLQDAFNIAFQLKENKDMIQFKYTMNSFENAINTGNVLLAKEFKDNLSEIVDHFTKKDIKSKKIDFSITLTPSLTNPSISADFGIPIECNDKRKINMNFIINLMQYGLTHRYEV